MRRAIFTEPQKMVLPDTLATTQTASQTSRHGEGEERERYINGESKFGSLPSPHVSTT